jgi:hypothetical protein
MSFRNALTIALSIGSLLIPARGRARAAPDLKLITNSVFRLAARRTSLSRRAPQPGSAPVSEKRVGLSRCPRRPGYGRLIALDRLAVRAIGGFPFGGLAPFGTSTGLSSCQRRLRPTLAPRTDAPATQAAQASRPRSGGWFRFVRFGRSVWAHDVSGTDWQILALSMQPMTTIMPVWQCGHSRNECPVSIS